MLDIASASLEHTANREQSAWNHRAARGLSLYIYSVQDGLLTSTSDSRNRFAAHRCCKLLNNAMHIASVRHGGAAEDTP